MHLWAYDPAGALGLSWLVWLTKSSWKSLKFFVAAEGLVDANKSRASLGAFRKRLKHARSSCHGSFLSDFFKKNCFSGKEILKKNVIFLFFSHRNPLLIFSLYDLHLFPFRDLLQSWGDHAEIFLQKSRSIKQKRSPTKMFLQKNPPTSESARNILSSGFAHMFSKPHIFSYESYMTKSFSI